ncbi:MAG: hypothetical protein C0596_19105 [Marinilabiliales bacterium]|nr:MAG: hypothetical protein C0596_19105 [Marinilabiliales bacterium]
MKKVISIVFYFLIVYSVFTQTPVDVAELTIKVGGMSTEEICYGFAEGDQIVFSFEEIKGKEIKEIEIVELPGNSKFQDFKASKIQEKKINVYKKGVYLFRFTNTAVGGRICKIKIQRIPKTEDLISFNTDWEWKTLYDTIYTPYKEDSLVGYDTLIYKETVKELIKTEQIEDMIVDKNQKVHSYWNENPCHTYLKIDLPKNQKQTYLEKKVIAWAYWIGVGEESNKAYARNVEAMGGLVSGLASTFVSPLAGLAVGTVTQLLLPTSGEDVEYAFIADYQNVQLFLAGQTYYQFDHGKGIAAYGKNTNRLQGTFYIGLYNDNQTTGINVNVKVVVIMEIKTFEDIEYDRLKITPRYVTVNKQKVDVKTSEVRVNVE